MDSQSAIPADPEVRRYSLDELLRLRYSLPVVTLPLSKVFKHVDIGSFFRLPEAALRSPESFSCLTKNLAEIRNLIRKTQVQHNSRRHVGESTEDSEYQSVAESVSTETHRFQWNLRRRESSDRSSQPHSAPTGIDAQQSENFQRFYRAVVSPTHVRVTAGGRIVPNTRSLAPPSFEWNGEKSHFDNPKQQAATVNSSNHQQSGSLPHQPLPAGYAPVFPTGFMSPYNLLPQGNGFAPLQMAPQGQSSSHVSDPKTIEGGQMPKISGEMTNQVAVLPQHIKLSPPAQFDQSRPFVINGQTVYPVSPGFQVPPNVMSMPISMIGAQSLLSQGSMPSPSGFQPHGIPVSLGGLPGPFMFPGGQQPPMMMQGPTQQCENGSIPLPYLPLPAMIPVRDFLTSQIQVLQNHLKLLEAQSGHQIDEAFVEAQRNNLQLQIKNLEATLEFQLGQGGKTKEAMGENRGSARSVLPADEQKAPSVADSQSIARSNRPQVSAETNASNQGTSTGKTTTMQDTKAASTSTRPESTSKSRLTMAAAMAPPFQPRAQKVVPPMTLQIPSFNDNGDSFDEVFTPESMAEIEARLLSKASSDWGRSSRTPVVGMGPAGLSRSQSVHEHSAQNYYSGHVPGFQRSSTFHSGQTALVPPNLPRLASQGVPYLVGTLPQGINLHTARPDDFMYSRPLTDDEVRARYLYWGKAPRAIQAGLPKFDGKDFYPPSPVKNSSRVSMVDFGAPLNTHRAPPTPSFSFETLFTEPGAPGYKYSASEQTGSTVSRPDSVPISQTSFERDYQGREAVSKKNSAVGLGSARSTNGSRPSSVRGNASTPLNSQRGVRVDPPVDFDFSTLFTENDPSYRSPSPPLRINSRKAVAYVEPSNEQPITPANLEFPKIGGSVGTDMELTSPESTASQSTSSTVEIHLSPQKKSRSPKVVHEGSFAERVENFRSADQQTLFLQNMLKNTHQSPMVGSALSGALSSATAQGYLPQYRGSAAASLAPAMLNLPAIDRESERLVSKDSGGVPSPMVVSSFLPENLPFQRERSQRQNPPSTEGLGAEGYMRYLSQKDDSDKKATNSGLPITASVSGSAVNNGW